MFDHAAEYRTTQVISIEQNITMGTTNVVDWSEVVVETSRCTFPLFLHIIWSSWRTFSIIERYPVPDRNFVDFLEFSEERDLMFRRKRTSQLHYQ